MAGSGQPPVVADAAAALAAQLLADRFVVITNPLGWQCRGCEAEVRASPSGEPGVLQPVIDQRAINRLAESAADHGLYCGRCDD